ncbi:MAG: hypothetical protein O9264_00970 [Leptospira sp.]|nr:hypothetical protein [Leptospira sp.]
MKNRRLALFTPFILILAINCNIDLPWEKKNRGNSDQMLGLGLALLSLSNNPQAREPRPFRGRSLAIYSSGTSVYDWNNDANIGTLADLNSVTNFPVESENGRFAFANIGNTQFRVADSGLNLSPHGDHYHVDKSNPSLILTSRLSLNLGTPVSVFSKNGKASFVFANGNVRFLEEKNIISQSNPTLESLGNVPTITNQSTVVWLNASKAVATNGNAFRFYTNRTAGTTETPANAPNCVNPGYPATHQTPISTQSYSNLNLEFSYNHTIVYPCDNGTSIIRHADSDNTGAGTYSFQTVGSNRNTNWKPLFRNNNYSVFGRNTKPIFFGNQGSDEETSLLRLDAETGTIRTLTSLPYRSQNFATEEMLGKQIAILRNDGVVSVYDADTLTLIRDLRFLPGDVVLTGTDAPKLYSTWNACFVLYVDSKGVYSIQEINLEEALTTRKVTLESKPLALTFHIARMKGADYEGPAHQ